MIRSNEPFVYEFVQKLYEKHGYDYVNNWRTKLKMQDLSDEEWFEYCFSSESPF